MVPTHRMLMAALGNRDECPPHMRRSALRFIPYGKFENATWIPWGNGRLVRKCRSRFGTVNLLGAEHEGRRTCHPRCAHRVSCRS